ncbi:hypothetical protein B4102_3773 [Heyndrickxia sporothermodurans]|uniref:Uncharacterized protein n=1 Tax=Heyndrickxia sporothermodurans TaxID=46224 RepID=A0A150KLI7_9BACI|nr:hypothetical protein B4102_3773 [Heyndrickxia sporothermodurans]
MNLEGEKMDNEYKISAMILGAWLFFLTLAFGVLIGWLIWN